MVPMRRPLLALLALVALLAGGYGVNALRTPDGEAPSDTVAVRELPQQARDTIALIERGGPFPYPRDGAVFGNREGRLPERPRGYYREYTVPTPGEDDRGPRRIVAGRDGELYYTADHYETFRRIEPDR